MPSRNELVIRAHAVGITPSNYPNDSKLEQKVLYMEKNGTTYTETLGTQTLTSDATNVSDGDTVTIGNRTYTFKTALTGVNATGLLTSDATAPSDGDTVTIEGVTYTFKTTLSSPAQTNEVLIGVSAAVALDNLKIAINASGGTEGTEYSVGTVAHPLVTATTNTNTTQLVQARQFGTAANQYSLGETSSHLAWGATKMGTVVTTEVAGVANVLDEVLIGADAATSLDNLKLAINNSATEGTQYSFGTKAHTQVTATTNTDTTQVVAARNAAYDNASIATTEASTHLSWGAATLGSGVRGVIAVNTSTAAGSAGVSGDKNLL
jgi:hypothetical protein